MQNRPAQQKDIAKILNVSVMTVSKALRDHPDISLQTKEKVKEAAQRIGYQVNLVARQLSTQKTYTLGVVMPKIAHSFYSRVLDGVYQQAKGFGYQILLAVSQEDAQIEQDNILKLLSMRVDGLLASVAQSTDSDRIFQTVRKSSTPLVFFDRVRKLPQTSTVTVDNYGGAFSAVEYAIQAGYSRIGHISGPSHLELSQQRRAGYIAALQKHHLPIRKEWIAEGRFGEQGGGDGFTQIWSQAEHPQAIFTVSDSVALGLYRAARDKGLRIPDDIAVVSFSDIEFASLLTPALTTIHEPAEQLGRTSVELLIKEIENRGKTKPRHIVLATTLQIRQSCPALREKDESRK